jgi:excisionase family DNA binding protein
VKKEFLRPSEVAPLLGVTSGRVCQLVAAGVIPATRRGRAIYIPRVAWERWLAEQGQLAVSAARRLAAGHDVSAG